MGTNYYLYDELPCPTCGHGGDPLHIGKSSAGWCFSLHTIPEAGLDSLHKWRLRWEQPGAEIQSEYGASFSAEQMLDIITVRSQDRSEPFGAAWLAENHAVPGPKGLARHAIGRHCVGHGAGTWDLVTGEFS